jgi:hypothetical protein
MGGASCQGVFGMMDIGFEVFFQEVFLEVYSSGGPGLSGRL